MADFIKGLELCERFFNECAKPIITKHFPHLKYTAGILGYGSDVLGYDDFVSTDHMWGPRFYMFLNPEDIHLKDDIMSALSCELPYSYYGYSVNFSLPDPNDNGVRRPEFIKKGRVSPLIWIQNIDDYLTEQLGTCALDKLDDFDWLSFSEHRLLSLTKAYFFTDELGCKDKIAALKFYPHQVKLYLIASNWDIIASEQAFVKRCGQTDDEVGSRIICARIAERIMRLSFLYSDKYAPYSKWFGRAFNELKIDEDLKRAIKAALSTTKLEERENMLLLAQILTAKCHNNSGLTQSVDFSVESYYGRNAKVIFAEKFSQAAKNELKGTALENMPLMGSFSQFSGLSTLYDEPSQLKTMKKIYKTFAGL